jgi:predicted RNase H-like HicB family nuclease
MNADRYTYRVTWSSADGEHVGLCAEFPSLSWLAKSPDEALQGIRRLVAEATADMEASGELLPMYRDRRQSPDEGLFERVGVRYEVALDILGAIIAHWAAVTAAERDKPTPEASIITEAERARAELRVLRDALDPRDSQQIEAVIARYAPIARALYNG